MKISIFVELILDIIIFFVIFFFRVCLFFWCTLCSHWIEYFFFLIPIFCDWFSFSSNNVTMDFCWKIPHICRTDDRCKSRPNILVARFIPNFCIRRFKHSIHINKFHIKFDKIFHCHAESILGTSANILLERICLLFSTEQD